MTREYEATEEVRGKRKHLAERESHAANDDGLRSEHDSRSRHRRHGGANLARAVLRTQEEHSEHAHDELTEVESDEHPHDRVCDVGLTSQGARREITQSVRDERECEHAPSGRTQRPELGPFTAKSAPKSRSRV